jgi:acyl-CoA synthetase (NDP forming)
MVRAPDLEALYDSAKALGLMRPPRGKRLLVVTTSGGAGILAVDQAERHGFEMAQLPPTVVEELETVGLPQTAVLSNPLDTTFCTATQYDAAVSVVDRYDVADLYLVTFGDPIQGATEVVKKLQARTKASIAVAFLGGGEVEKIEGPRIQAAGIPVFPTPERAIRAMASAEWWFARSKKS